MRLLVVEDEIKTGDYLQQGLTEAGFMVTLARNGLDGHHLAMTETFDLLVLDVMLPERRGADRCTWCCWLDVVLLERRGADRWTWCCCEHASRRMWAVGRSRAADARGWCTSGREGGRCNCSLTERSKRNRKSKKRGRKKDKPSLDFLVSAAFFSTASNNSLPSWSVHQDIS